MPTLKKQKPIIWSLADMWNEVAYREPTVLKKRDYIYASEIGMPFYDRYLKMKAVPFTNPPNERSRRKFLAGNIWEYTVKQILIACGIYRQEEVTLNGRPYDHCLDVHGRCDFVAGGFVDGEAARIAVAQLKLPDFLFVIADKIIAGLADKRLEEKILELKSVSTFAMDKVEGMGAPMPNHTLQGYHYHKNGKWKADVAYICKDDCRMAQFPIGKATEPLYLADLEQMTDHYRAGKKPPLAPLLSFDYTFGTFVKNIYVEYSPYLSHYGFDTPDDFRAAINYLISWNRTLGRFVMAETGVTTPTGKAIQITPKNYEVKAAIIKAGYDFKKLIDCKIKIGVDQEEE